MKFRNKCQKEVLGSMSAQEVARKAKSAISMLSRVDSTDWLFLLDSIGDMKSRALQISLGILVDDIHLGETPPNREELKEMLMNVPAQSDMAESIVESIDSLSEPDVTVSVLAESGRDALALANFAAVTRTLESLARFATQHEF